MLTLLKWNKHAELWCTFILHLTHTTFRVHSPVDMFFATVSERVAS